MAPVRGSRLPHAGKIHEWGRDRKGVAVVWGMEFETMLILTVLAVQGVNLLFVAFLASRGTGLILELFQELDEKLAGAIQKVIQEGGIEGIEQVNPLQAAIAQMLIGKMNDNTPQRAPTGQFLPNVE